MFAIEFKRDLFFSSAIIRKEAFSLKELIIGIADSKMKFESASLPNKSKAIRGFLLLLACCCILCVFNGFSIIKTTARANAMRKSWVLTV